MKSSVEDLLEWASVEFRQSWERLCHVAHRLSLGAELSPEEARVRVLFSPLEVDYAAVYPLLGALWRTLLFQPARLATVVHDGHGRVVRSYFEDTRDGHFVSVRPLDLPEIVPLEGPELLSLANDRSTGQGLPRTDWVKIADLRFFELFREAGYDWRKLFVAARTAIENGWIRFHPVPPVFQAMFRWMRRMRHVDPNHLRLPDVPAPEAAVAVRGPDFTTVLHTRKLAIRVADRGPFEGLAQRLVESGVAPRTLALRAEPLLKFVRDWLHREKWDFYFAPAHFAEAGRFAKRFGDWWDVAPRPSGLSRFTVWLARWIFLPLDVDFLLRRGVAGVLREVIRQNGESRFGFVVEDRGRALAAVELRFCNGSVEEIHTHPPERFDNSVEPATAFGYNARFPVVVVHLDSVLEWLRFGEAPWKERLRIASRSPVSLFPESLSRKVPRRRRWWIWQAVRLPFLRR